MTELQKPKTYLYDWEDVKRLMPHRYPFLFIDRVISVDRSGVHSGERIAGTKIHAMKCVTGNEEMLQGHFPSMAVLPGVVLIEMMAQCSMFALPETVYQNGRFPKVYLSKVENCRFRAMVKPGDVLDIYCHVTKEKRGFSTFETHVLERDSQSQICDATLMAFFDLGE
jgi:3-hydroxymyristoyl/3-hydroxydecanoyl-(acyl carrier protein) dehydratase